MTTQRTDKVRTFLLSDQVEKILHSYGLSRAFNLGDFHFFRTRTQGSFNQAQEIADMFVQEYKDFSDFNQYQF